MLSVFWVEGSKGAQEPKPCNIWALIIRIGLFDWGGGGDYYSTYIKRPQGNSISKYSDPCIRGLGLEGLERVPGISMQLGVCP